MIESLMFIVLLFTCYGVECVDPYPSEPANDWGYSADYFESDFCQNSYLQIYERISHNEARIYWLQGCFI